MMALVYDNLAGGHILNGTAGSDSIFGQDGNDTLNGDTGDDRLNGGLNNDVLNGGGGTDTADYSSGLIFDGTFFRNVTGATANVGVRVDLNVAIAQNTGGAGLDTLISIENITGTNAAAGDTLIGNAVANVLSGLDGNDCLFGNAGNDTLKGGNGNDLLNGGLGNDTLDGGAGIDTASYNNGPAWVGAAGNVTVNLGTGLAQATVGAGSDTLVLGTIENLIGTDNAVGGDLLTGDGNNNVLWGLNGNDTLVGNAGNDTLNGGLGADILNGGAGIDTADYSNHVVCGQTLFGATAGVTVNLNVGGAQATGGAGLDTLVLGTIENITGSTFFGDTLIGNAGSNILSGLGGNDCLFGNAGNDILLGGDGNDVLNGGLGGDILDGGAGTDTASYIGAAAAVTVDLGLGGAQGLAGGDALVLGTIENLVGSSFGDSLIGNAGANELIGGQGAVLDVLRGNGGNDVLNGGLGSDLLDGGTGIDTADYSDKVICGTSILGATGAVTVNLNLGGAQALAQGDTLVLGAIENITGSTFFGDTLIGNAGNNVLSGLGGNDTLRGGSGQDRLTGGTGNDTFDYNFVTDSQPGAASRDIIQDFTGAGAAAGDVINLFDIDANGGGLGNGTFSWIGGAAFNGINAIGQLRFSGGILQGSTDADAAAEFEIQLTGVPNLTLVAADFVL